MPSYLKTRCMSQNPKWFFSGFCMWSIYSSNNFDDFSMFLIKFSLYNMPTYFIWLLPFSSHKRVKMGLTPKILKFYFKCDFDRVFVFIIFVKSPSAITNRFDLPQLLWFLR